MNTGTIKVFAAVIALVLSGCAQNSHTLRSDISFLKTSPDSIVVLGTQSVMPHEVLWLKGYPSFRMVWEPSSPPGSLTPMSALTINTADTFLGVDTGGSSDIKWHVARVPAGTYTLRRITTNLGNHIYNTNFSTPHYLFTLKPGEVRYIGDLHFDVKSFPVKLVKVTRTGAMAKTELAKYPGIQVAPVFQQPSVVISPGARPQMINISR